MNRKWRPYMAATYMVICSFDFVLAPILWSILQLYAKGSISSQWTPLTLQGSGLLHLSFGAILGVSAYGRTQEKINNATSLP